jgi:hypothetical protein
MIPSHRQSFNTKYRPEKYSQLLSLLAERCGVPIGFRVSETPCFLPVDLLEKMAAYGKDLIHQLVDSAEYRAHSAQSIPPEFNVPRESPHPTFVQVDFGLVRDGSGTLQPRLVELQAFPSLYAYQPVLARSFMEIYGLDEHLRYLLSGLDSASYLALLRKAIVGNQDLENVILMEIDPQHQKTLPDFLVTEKLLGIRTVCITKLKKEGNRLYWVDSGRAVPVKRIYNRAIVDELERKGLKLAFDFRDDLDVEWAGHPNWYFRISKYSIPYLQHPSVPKTWFLDRLEHIPEDLENYALKPLYSFAGLGVNIAPKKEDIAAVPRGNRSQYILQERLHFEPVIETPFGGTKVEVRVMYVWVDELTPVLTILRMGRGLMMGVDHNRDMEWVGSSAGLYQPNDPA